jgi:CRP-like cAMP-binding protein
MTTVTPPGGPDFSLKTDSKWERLALHRVPQQYLLMAAFWSYAILGVTYLEGTTIWVAFGLALFPWTLLVFVELEWSYKHFGWFALFGFMAFVQTIHYSEHVIEVIQYHIFNDSLADSTAIFSKFNIEGVHLAGDTFLTIGTIVLLSKFPHNPWLWVAVPFQLAHQMEHTFLGYEHWISGAPQGSAGLLGKDGAFFGGLPFTRVDLHWMYNTLYTIPFVLALIYQLKRTYDEALDEAFPDAPKAELLETSRHLETIRYVKGQTILAPGEDIQRLYIISEGEAEVYTHGPDGEIQEVARLHRGQYIGDIGLLVRNAPHTKTVRAVTNVTTLAMDEATFRHLMAASDLTHDEMLDLAGGHMAHNEPVLPAPRRASNGAPKATRAVKSTGATKTATRARKQPAKTTRAAKPPAKTAAKPAAKSAAKTTKARETERSS